MKSVQGKLSVPIKKGTDIPFPMRLSYMLRHTYKESHRPVSFNFFPPLPEETIVHDIKVGKNCQTGCAGEFYASILQTKPALYFDPAVHPGMDIQIDLTFNEPYEGTLVIVVVEATGQSDYKNRLVPMPLNERGICAPQVEGMIDRFYVSPWLQQQLKDGDVKVIATPSVNVPEHQTAPRYKPLDLKLEDGMLRVKKPHKVGFCDAILIEYSDRHGHSPFSFSPAHVLPIVNTRPEDGIR